MSYTLSVKNEILQKTTENKDENLSELFAIFLAKDSIKEYNITLRTENIGLAKRVYNTLRKYTEFKIVIRYLTSKKLGLHKIYEVHVPYQKRYIDFVKKLFEYKNVNVINEDHKFKGLIKGYFLCCGYLRSPEKGYAMDFFIDTEDASTFLYFLIKEHGKKVHQTDKKNKSLVYLRNSEDILDLLIIMDAINAFFKFEEIIINKEIRNKINRNINWEIANETKKLSTAEKQLKIINYLEENDKISDLSSVLKEFIVMRKDNPDASLQELAEKMEISKSGIRNRFRRIETYYNDLISENN